MFPLMKYICFSNNYAAPLSSSNIIYDESNVYNQTQQNNYQYTGSISEVLSPSGTPCRGGRIRPSQPPPAPPSNNNSNNRQVKYIFYLNCLFHIYLF